MSPSRMPGSVNERRKVDGVYRWAVLCTVSFAILLRLCTGTHSYSGMNTPPTFGDYEAQRHWMEITTNLPPNEWYKNGPTNNLSYWGLDYPPLSGYQSWLCGKFIEYFEPKAVALKTSLGYETASSKLLMRSTVIISDLLVYFPACLVCAAALYKNPGQKLGCIIAMMLNPALIIIDHGHFQYNSISLGCAVASVSSILAGHPLLGSFLFCASLSHKQMSLYLAPAFFAHLLGECLQRKGWRRKLGLLALLGITVLSSFVIMWAPFLTSSNSILAVLTRVFPTQRGLFEDYVANFWCVSSLVIKWKRLVQPQVLFRLCTGATLVAFLPSMVAEIANPSPTGFLLCLANTAMAFFMFSFQVHEKSILLPLLPLTMLTSLSSFSLNGGGDGVLGPALMHSVMLSIYPLLEKDGLQDAYVGLLIIHLGLVCLLWSDQEPSTAKRNLTKRTTYTNKLRSPWSHSPLLSLAIITAIHGIRVTIPPPSRYPFLWDALMVSWAFLNFIEVFVHLYRTQLQRK